MNDCTALPNEYLEELAHLSDSEYGRLVRAIQKYHCTGEESELTGTEKYHWTRVRMAEDRHQENSKKRAKAGSTGGTNSSKLKQSQANLSKAKQTEASSSPKPKPKPKPKPNPSITGDSSAQVRFTPPTADEVRAYCQERGNNVDAERFVDFYASKGWKVGAQPMKDWKAAVRTWEAREDKPKGETVSTGGFVMGERELEAIRRRRDGVS